MVEYHKIQSMFKRDMANGGKMLFGQWTLPEFEYLQNNQWVFTEKVDGTNVRVMWNGTDVTLGGKTDNAQLHMELVYALQALFDGTKNRQLWRDTFPAKVSDSEVTMIIPTQVCFYGEGYGPGIQKSGGLYRQDKSFVLFDIKIGNLWLERKNVEDIAAKFGVGIVPIVGEGTLNEGVELVRDGFTSKWSTVEAFMSEGIVARPKVELRTRRGERMITKIKHRDFYNI